MKPLQISKVRKAMDAYVASRDAYASKPGVLDKGLVRFISNDKNEPDWMLQKRLKALELFRKTPMPKWGPDLGKLDMKKIVFYRKPDAEQANDWEKVPEQIKRTFEALGIPEAERKSLAGAGAQFESNTIYHNLKKEFERLGVIFEDMDIAVQKYPEFVKKYFMTNCIQISEHKFIMLHAAVWSGGTFIYVPEGVKVGMPLQAYFRMNARRGGQFEHTLIIAEKRSEVSYIEGCFTKGTLITTTPDYAPIEGIKIGDKVLTHQGDYRPVYHVQERPYTGELYTIKANGDSTAAIEATEEHPFLCVRREKGNERNTTWKKNWVSAKDLRRMDYLAVPKIKKTASRKTVGFEIEFKRKKEKIIVPANKAFFRLVGYYLAEGSISNNSYLNFSFGSHERNYIEDTKKLLKEVFDVTKVLEPVHKTNHGTSVVVCSSKLARLFKHFGTSAETKGVPNWMLLEEPEKQKELIIGLFRGDGNYYNKRTKNGWLKEVFRISTTSGKLARQIRDILLRMDVVAFLNKRERAAEGRKAIYTVGITGEFLQPFGNLVGRKTESKLNNKKRATMFYVDREYAYLPIREISKRQVENLPVYNFSVEGGESYVANGVAVHNCSAPQFGEAKALHAGCVEIFVGEGARVRYSSIENWSTSTFNLNTKRAIVEKNAVMEWVGGNMGSCTTMLYPSSILKGEGARVSHLGIAYAGSGQNQDTGAKVYHLAPNTSSHIRMKSISKDGGICTYRGTVKVAKGAKNSRVASVCDALILDRKSVSNTIPKIDVGEDSVEVSHEATVGRLSTEKIFYLMSRGLKEEEAVQMIVSGFIEPVMKELPLEYAVELNKLIQLEMTGAVG